MYFDLLWVQTVNYWEWFIIISLVKDKKNRSKASIHALQCAYFTFLVFLQSIYHLGGRYSFYLPPKLPSLSDILIRLIRKLGSGPLRMKHRGYGSVAGPRSDPTSGQNYFEDLFLKLKITNKLFVSCSIISKHNQNN